MNWKTELALVSFGRRLGTNAGKTWRVYENIIMAYLGIMVQRRRKLDMHRMIALV
jgi:hypothetical protein